LVKRYGSDKVLYWRTKEKKEIDFVVRLPETILPVETKLHFPRSIPTTLHTFAAIYGSNDKQAPSYRLVGLNGQPAENGMVFPWQL
jgi:hypothetical protein